MFSRSTKPREEPGDGASSPQPPDDRRYLRGMPLWTLFLALCLTASLITLYVMIIATAIPSITADFNTISDLDWYSTAYLLPLCAMQPLAGKIYTYFSLKITYLIFIATFEAGNLICALAPTSAAFIAGRAVAGLGGAGLFNGGMVMLTAAAHPQLRPTLMGLGVAMTAIGGVAGPVMGGALTQHIGWRWCLWIFLPPGALAAVLFFFLPIPEQTTKPPIRSILPSLPQKLDVFGFLLFAPACVMILLAMSWGGQRYPWNNAKIIGLLCGAAGTAVIFGAWQWHRQDKALIPPSIVRNPVVFYGCLVSFLQGGAFLMMGYYLPLWFQSVKQASPTSSGLMLLPTMISQIISSALSGALVSKLAYVPPWALIGSVLSAIGSGLMTAFLPDTSEGHWVGYQILVGVGRGFVLQMPVIALQGMLPGKEISTGTAITQFCQYFGGTVFLAIAKSVFENGLHPALRQFAPGIDPDQILNAGATNLLRDLSPDDVAGVIMAYNKALAATFWLPTVAGILAAFFSFGLGWTKVAGKGARKSGAARGLAKNGNPKENETKEVTEPLESDGARV